MGSASHAPPANPIILTGGAHINPTVTPPPRTRLVLGLGKRGEVDPHLLGQLDLLPQLQQQPRCHCIRHHAPKLEATQHYAVALAKEVEEALEWDKLGDVQRCDLEPHTCKPSGQATMLCWPVGQQQLWALTLCELAAPRHRVLEKVGQGVWSKACEAPASCILEGHIDGWLAGHLLADFALGGRLHPVIGLD